MNKPVKHFFGDSDGDGVMNMFDCQPHNKRKQGSEHTSGFTQGLTPLPELGRGKRVGPVSREDKERFREGVERLNKAAVKAERREARDSRESEGED